MYSIITKIDLRAFTLRKIEITTTIFCHLRRCFVEIVTTVYRPLDDDFQFS